MLPDSADSEKLQAVFRSGNRVGRFPADEDACEFAFPVDEAESQGGAGAGVCFFSLSKRKVSCHCGGGLSRKLALPRYGPYGQNQLRKLRVSRRVVAGNWRKRGISPVLSANLRFWRGDGSFSSGVSLIFSPDNTLD